MNLSIDLTLEEGGCEQGFLSGFGKKLLLCYKALSVNNFLRLAIKLLEGLIIKTISPNARSNCRMITKESFLGPENLEGRIRSGKNITR